MIAKQRKEGLKMANAKSQVQYTAAKAEVDQLLEQVSELREERDRQAAKESEQHAHDAVIRRLDNERQYLKSQLTSEITHKGELRKALTTCQQQLAEVQRQWREDVNTLKERTMADNQEAVTIEQRLRVHHSFGRRRNEAVIAKQRLEGCLREDEGPASRGATGDRKPFGGGETTER